MAEELDSWFEPFYASLIEWSLPQTDNVKYVALLERGAKAGDDHACYALSGMYLHGFKAEGVKWRKNTKRGMRLLKQASRSVHMAMTELAMFYESGEFGLRKNAQKAFQLFEKSVEYGSICARFHLGRCYYFGVGTKPDRRRSARLFREAEALGFPVPEEAPR